MEIRDFFSFLSRRLGSNRYAEPFPDRRHGPLEGRQRSQGR